MEIYKATLNDLNDLIQLRVDFLKMDAGHLSEEDENAIRIQVKSYFEKHLAFGDFVATIAKVDGQIASAAFLIIQERPANLSFPTGVTATLLNVITYPEYRQKGLATRVVEAIIKEAKKKNVSSIELYSTGEGKSLYKKLGFKQPSYEAMRLKL